MLTRPDCLKCSFFYSSADAYETGFGWNVVIPNYPTLLVGTKEEAREIAEAADLDGFGSR